MKHSKQLIDRVLKSVEKALAELDDEIARHRDGIGTVSSLDQLSRFRERFRLIQEELLHGQPTFAKAGIGQVIVDSWPLDAPLGELLCKAEQDYMSLQQIDS